MSEHFFSIKFWLWISKWCFGGCSYVSLLYFTLSDVGSKKISCDLWFIYYHLQNEKYVTVKNHIRKLEAQYSSMRKWEHLSFISCFIGYFSFAFLYYFKILCFIFFFQFMGLLNAGHWNGVKDPERLPRLKTPNCISTPILIAKILLSLMAFIIK